MTIKTEPIDEEWYRRLQDSGFTSDTIFDEGQHEDLKELLLAVGGGACVLRWKDPDKEKIMTRGRLVVPTVVKMLKGDHNHCHSNSARFWRENRENVRLMTGYALANDGAWRQHTWCVDDSDVVYESTERAAAYFGFELDTAEASLFHEQNAC
jgi:hypothetical protein